MTNTCPDCGVQITRKAKRCASCAGTARWARAAYREEYRRKHTCPDCGVKITSRGRRCRSCAAKTLCQDPEYRRKLSKRAKAHWQRPAYRAKLTGENHHRWRDGASQQHYPPEFGAALRQAIRERDGFICILCGEPQNGRALDVHHIDGNKHNNGMSNLISLHAGCHRTVHTDDDFDYWRVGFQALMVRKFPEEENE